MERERLAAAALDAGVPVTVLPLLELTLYQVWDRRAGTRLTREAYQRVGGVRGGLLLKLYSHSLSIALVLLFLISFVLHAIGGAGGKVREVGLADRRLTRSRRGAHRFLRAFSL